MASLGGARQRALLARLLLAYGEPVDRDQLLHDVFEPDAGAKALPVAISRLRRSLEPLGLDDRLGTTNAGYVLRLHAGELDARRLEELVVESERAIAVGRWREAAQMLNLVADLWGGPPLDGAAPTPWTAAAAERLLTVRIRAGNSRAGALVQLGRLDEAIAELTPLLARHPDREQLRAVLMLALYRARRPAAALTVYREGERLVAERFGVEPGPRIRRLAQLIAAGDERLLTTGMAIEHPAHLVRPPDARLVGRSRELATLREALDDCRGGARIAALISGEPGIGKTRLVWELSVTARSAGCTVLAGRCPERAGDGFHPFIEALGEVAAALPDELIAAHGRAHGAVLARMLPALAPRLRDQRSRADDGRVVPGSAQYGLFAALADLLWRIGRATPVVLSLEDLQWADRSTLLLATHLLTGPVAPRMLLAATFRSGAGIDRPELASFLSETQREPETRWIELTGLDVADVAELLADRRVDADADSDGDGDGDGGDAISGADAEALCDVTGGNPFFINELLRASDPVRSGAAGLPPSVVEAIRRRVRELGEPADSVLATAAVLGDDCDPALIATVLDQPAETVDRALSAAVRAGVLQRSDARDGRLTFKHALIAQTLVSGVPDGRRAALHRGAARVLAAAPSVDAERVARHWQQAGDGGEQALSWTIAAGRQALERLAPARAQRLLEQALAMLDDSAGDPGRPESRIDGDPARAEILLALGTAQLHAGDPAFRDTLLRAAATAQRAGADELCVRAAVMNTRGWVSAVGGCDERVIAVVERALALVGPEPTARRARLLAILAGELTFTSEWSRRAAVSDEALRIARGLGDPSVLVSVVSHRYLGVWHHRTLEQRLAETDECRRAAILLGDPAAQFHSLIWRAGACTEAGRFAEAVEARARAVEIAERLRQPTIMWMARFTQAEEHILGGRLAPAEERAQAALELGLATGQPDARMLFASQMVIIRYDQGRLDELTGLISETVAENPRLTGYRSILAGVLVEQDELHAAAAIMHHDAPDRFRGMTLDVTWLSALCTYAQVAARTIPAQITPPRVGFDLCALLRPWADVIAYLGPAGGRIVAYHLGMLEVALGRLEAAHVHLTQAQRTAERLPVPIWAQRARVELGRCLLKMGEPRAAVATIEGAIAGAAALGAGGVVRDGERVLADARIAGGEPAALTG